jgi:flagellar biosynthesis protein FliP
VRKLTLAMIFGLLAGASDLSAQAQGFDPHRELTLDRNPVDPEFEDRGSASGETPRASSVPPETNREDLPSSLKLLVVMSIFSLAPALLMMTTCFVRFSIVFGLLKQAIGTPNIPPQQVMTALSLFLTFLVMAPVWEQSYETGIQPYLDPSAEQRPLTEYEAFQRSMIPIREFMGGQIERTGNQDAVWMFWDYYQNSRQSLTTTAVSAELPRNYQEVPLPVLLPAYLVSELKTAFLIGFRLFLPFLVIDLVISSVLTSSGMLMLPPVLVSLPFKLLLFVLIDGWSLVAGMMLESVRPLTG